MKKYICTKDFQGGNFGVGRVQTVEEWKETADEWADFDDDWNVWEIFEGMTDKEVIDYIQDMWEIEIIEVKEKFEKYAEAITTLEEIYNFKDEQYSRAYNLVIEDLIERVCKE